MSVALEFSKNSTHYGTYNIIQNSVCSEVVKNNGSYASCVVDLGCGEGALFREISKNNDWNIERFIAVDFSEGMLALHPKHNNVELRCDDFNNDALFEYLQEQQCEHLFSLSALQWADNLENIFYHLARLNCKLSLAIFTSGTFKTLHKSANVEGILKSATEIEGMAKKYLNAQSYVKSYSISFDTTREMLQYIKKSGVSGSRNVLNVSQMRKLMQEYPLNYLEFEVIFINTL